MNHPLSRRDALATLTAAGAGLLVSPTTLAAAPVLADPSGWRKEGELFRYQGPLVGGWVHYRLGAQTIDLEVCFFTDGIVWERPLRQAWVTRDAPEATAASYLLHAPHAMVRRDERWHLFYTGGNFAHNHLDSHGTPDRAILLATRESLFV